MAKITTDNKQQAKQGPRLFTVSAAPHMHNGDSISKVMRWVIIALLPAVAASMLFFKQYAVELIAISVTSCVVFEYLWQRMLKQPVRTGDLSAVVTGLLLAMTLPPTLPWWMAVAGSFFSIIIGKQVFGGLSHNPFNPALAGRAFLQLAWPQAMNSWMTPIDCVTSASAVDSLTTATPLTITKWNLHQALPSNFDLLAGYCTGSLGETSALALIIGGIILVLKKQIFAVTPLTYIGTVGLGAYLLGLDPVFHIFTGGLMLGAIYMATDPSTAPVSNPGRFIFAFGCGALTLLIRLKGGYPEGVCFAILIMNMFVPLIDKAVITKPFGYKRLQ